MFLFELWLRFIQLHVIRGKTKDNFSSARWRRQCHEVEHAVFAMACRTHSHNATNESAITPWTTALIVISWPYDVFRAVSGCAACLLTHARAHTHSSFSTKWTVGFAAASDVLTFGGQFMSSCGHSGPHNTSFVTNFHHSFDCTFSASTNISFTPHTCARTGARTQAKISDQSLKRTRSELT